MRLIVTSQSDVAGSNVYNVLSKSFNKGGEFEGKPVFKKGDTWLIATKERQINARHLDSHFNPEYYVFASRHSSASKERTLTVHVPGNISAEAKFGGRPHELAYCNADAMKAALKELHRGKEEMGLDYNVSFEATHHGPTELKKPVLFVEVGSTLGEWNDQRAVEIVARAVLKAAESREAFEKAIGIGGSHYAPLHTRVALESEIAIGHIIPSYSIADLKEETLLQAVKKTNASFAYLDWKGMDVAQRSKVMEMSSRIGLEVKRGRDLRPQTPELKGYHEYSVSSVLISEAEKVSRPGLEKAFSDRGAIARYSKDGKFENVFAAPKDIRNEIIRACINILKQKYQVTEDLEAGTLTFTESRFDVEKARNLGLKPGPLFSELSKGKAVSLHGVTITPDMVQKRVEKIIDLRAKT